MSVSKPVKRRKYDDAFKTEALRLARESRSTRAAARQLHQDWVESQVLQAKREATGIKNSTE